jgi:hypothetical protein
MGIEPVIPWLFSLYCSEYMDGSFLACILLLLYKVYPNICFTVTGRLNAGISQIKQVLAAKFTTENQESQEELTKHIEKVVKTATSK